MDHGRGVCRISKWQDTCLPIARNKHLHVNDKLNRKLMELSIPMFEMIRWLKLEIGRDGDPSH